LSLTVIRATIQSSLKNSARRRTLSPSTSVRGVGTTGATGAPRAPGAVQAVRPSSARAYLYIRPKAAPPWEGQRTAIVTSSSLESGLLLSLCLVAPNTLTVCSLSPKGRQTVRSSHPNSRLSRFEAAAPARRSQQQPTQQRCSRYSSAVGAAVELVVQR